MVFVRRISTFGVFHELLTEGLSVVWGAINSEDWLLDVSCVTLQQYMCYWHIMVNWDWKALVILAAVAGKNSDHMKFWLQYGMGVNLSILALLHGRHANCLSSLSSRSG